MNDNSEITALRAAMRALYDAIDPIDFVRVLPGERLLNGTNNHEVFFNTEPKDVVVIAATTAVFDAYDNVAELLAETE